MLLSLLASTAREVPLANHPTFVECQDRESSTHLFNELIRLVYVTFYIHEAGCGETDRIVYDQAIAAQKMRLTAAYNQLVAHRKNTDNPEGIAALHQRQR